MSLGYTFLNMFLNLVTTDSSLELLWLGCLLASLITEQRTWPPLADWRVSQEANYDTKTEQILCDWAEKCSIIQLERTKMKVGYTHCWMPLKCCIAVIDVPMHRALILTANFQTNYFSNSSILFWEIWLIIFKQFMTCNAKPTLHNADLRVTFKV